MENFWEKKGWEHEDVHLSELKTLPFKREIPSLSLEPGLFVIRGPRQIGKSSWLKTELTKAIKMFEPKNSFFASCENLRDHIDLSTLLKSQAHRKFFFLDEVTFVRDWSRAVKHFLDTQKSKVVIVTGSNAIDLRKGSDRMPGRHRGGGEFTLLPMTFDEFVKARQDANWIPKKFDRVSELQNYFRIGGFPLAVIEAGARATEPSKAKKIYTQWLVGDVVKAGKSEVYLKETLSQIFQTSQSSLSLQKLAQRTQMGSHHTALEYVQVLEDCFALTTLYAIDPNSGAKRLRKDKKFYFRDPLIYAIAKEFSGETVSQEKWNEVLAEAVACEFLLRSYPRFGYLHSPKGEIDFFSRKNWAIEVKWSTNPSNLSRVFKDLQIPWKTLWHPQNFLVDLPSSH